MNREPFMYGSFYKYLEQELWARDALKVIFTIK